MISCCGCVSTMWIEYANLYCVYCGALNFHMSGYFAAVSESVFLSSFIQMFSFEVTEFLEKFQFGNKTNESFQDISPQGDDCKSIFLFPVYLIHLPLVTPVHCMSSVDFMYSEFSTPTHICEIGV